MCALILAAAVPACVGTPIPEPPNVTEPDIDLIGAIPDRDIRHQVLIITGATGSATPGTTLWAVNLDTAIGEIDPPVQVPIADDGSFNARLDGAVGDELRLQVREGDERSNPVDVITQEGGGLVHSERQSCIVLTPSYELDFDSVVLEEESPATIELRNECDGTLELTDLRLRVETAPFEIDRSAPLTLESGEGASLDLRFLPLLPGLNEEILFLELTGTTPAFSERRPMTLFGIGRER